MISGELSGAELNKFNADALRDWNDAALLACEFCSRFGTARKIAAIVFVNLTRCSLKLDHVNLVAPGSPTDGSMQAILTQLPV